LNQLSGQPIWKPGQPAISDDIVPFEAGLTPLFAGQRGGAWRPARLKLFDAWLIALLVLGAQLTIRTAISAIRKSRANVPP
jgi:hypothetical protein